MNITWPTQLVNSTIQEIRNTIGRELTINVRVPGTACPICDLDPVTNVSTNPFCPVCNGFYWIDTLNGVTVSGHILWSPADSPYKTSGGLLPEGACKVTIAYTDSNRQYVEDADSFLVDGKTLSLKSYALRGVPSPNRIRIILTEEVAESSVPTSSVFIIGQGMVGRDRIG